MTRSDTFRLPPPGAGGSDRTTEAAAGALEAQLLGQAGLRRGLRGGAPVLKGARSAYLATQWSGADDRRPASGLLRRVRA